MEDPNLDCGYGFLGGHHIQNFKAMTHGQKQPEIIVQGGDGIQNGFDAVLFFYKQSLKRQRTDLFWI